MKKIGRIAGIGLMILLCGAAAFGLGWYWGTTSQMLRSAMIQATRDLAVLSDFAKDEPSEAIERLELELETNAIVAGIALSDPLTPSGDKRFAECVLARVKKYRDSKPSFLADAGPDDFLTKLLARDFECRMTAA